MVMKVNKEIDNLNLLTPLLNFESPDDFYYLQILQRKKENPQLGSNSRVIKNYYIKSVDHLEKRYDEIKELCRLFNARASLRLNKRSFEKVAFKALLNISNTMMSRDYDFIGKAYDRACGQSSNEKREKKWIIDIDSDELPWKMDICNFIERCEPITGSKKVLCEIPSKTGVHIITKPFNRFQFSKEINEYISSRYQISGFDLNLDIHKDNPTNLYIPY